MNYLLDTHTLLWLDDAYENLSGTATSIIENTDNRLFFSAASVWEIQIKVRLGKLSLRLSLPALIEEQQQTNSMQLLPIELDHIFELDNLENHHRDPFDRLLIAQARIEGLPILSRDPKIAQYDVEVAW